MPKAFPWMAAVFAAIFGGFGLFCGFLMLIEKTTSNPLLAIPADLAGFMALELLVACTMGWRTPRQLFSDLDEDYGV